MASTETKFVEFIGGNSVPDRYQCDTHTVNAGRMRAFRYHELPAHEADALLARHPTLFKAIEQPPAPATANPPPPVAPAPEAPPANAAAGDTEADAAVSSTPPVAPAPEDSAPDTSTGTPARRGRGKNATQAG